MGRRDPDLTLLPPARSGPEPCRWWAWVRTFLLIKGLEVKWRSHEDVETYPCSKETFLTGPTLSWLIDLCI